MTVRDIVRRRLAAQRLVPPGTGTIAENVSAVCGLQAQDYHAALWSIGVRCPGSSAGEVERAFADRQIVRGWPLRGTLHVVASADLRWLLSISGPRALLRAAGRHRQLGIDEGDIAKARRVLERALAGGPPLTRARIFDLFREQGPDPAGQRGIHVLWSLSLAGVLCHGPRDGKQDTFTLLDEWIPRTVTPDPEEALARLAVRYLDGHGPATAADLAWWAGITRTEAARAMVLAGAALRMERLGETEYWSVTDAAAAAPRVRGTLLLPAFDEYLLGYTDRTAILDPAHAYRVAPGANGLFRPVVVVDGRVTGTWRAEKKRGAVRVEAEFFDEARGTETALAREGERYAGFLGKGVGT